MTGALTLALILAVSTPQLCQSPYADSKPDADGYVYMGGALIGDLAGRTYAIDRFCDCIAHKLLLKVSTGVDSAGNPLWRTLDRVLIRSRSDKRYFAFGQRVCRRGTTYDAELIATALESDDEFLPALMVWRANRAKGRFERVSNRGITCRNQGYGL